MQIRFAKQEDVAALSKIERSAASSWSEELIAVELKHSGGVRLVALDVEKEEIAGWCCARFVVPEAELLKITLFPKYRRKGVGTLLIEKLVEIIAEKSCSAVFLEVRAGNHAARSFYNKLGFRQIGRRKDYYTNPTEDAIILQYTLTIPTEPRSVP